MAKVVRYFSTAAAGTGDGTSWANRAALFSSGNWSSVITGFNFSGADSLECRIGPGSYTGGQTLQQVLFANEPTRFNALYLVGAASGGDPLEPADPVWSSAQGGLDVSGMPAIDLGNFTLNLPNTHLSGLDLTGSNTLGVMGANGSSSHSAWCRIIATGTNTPGLAARGLLANCEVRCTSANYAAIVSAQANMTAHNVRMVGNPGASGGTRHGLQTSANTSLLASHCTVIDTPGYAYANTGNAVVSAILQMLRSTAYDCGGGFLGSATSTLTTASLHTIIGCLAVNNAAYGVSMTQGPVLTVGGRFRDNTSGNFLGDGNGLQINPITDAGTDADEFVDAAAGDLRIKNTSSLWGLGIGPADQPAASGGGGGTRAWWG